MTGQYRNNSMQIHMGFLHQIIYNLSISMPSKHNLVESYIVYKMMTVFKESYYSLNLPLSPFCFYFSLMYICSLLPVCQPVGAGDAKVIRHSACFKGALSQIVGNTDS